MSFGNVMILLLFFSLIDAGWKRELINRAHTELTEMGIGGKPPGFLRNEAFLSNEPFCDEKSYTKWIEKHTDPLDDD